MSIILFATLSVPGLGGAGSFREAAPRVSAFGELKGQLPTPFLPLQSNHHRFTLPAYPRSGHRKMPSLLPPPEARQTKAQENACVPRHKLACSEKSSLCRV